MHGWKRYSRVIRKERFYDHEEDIVPDFRFYLLRYPGIPEAGKGNRQMGCTYRKKHCPMTGDLISQPLLMIAGSIADTFYMTEKVFASAIGTQKKELFLIKGATHIETYWKPEYVKQAADKLVDFFGNNL